MADWSMYGPQGGMAGTYLNGLGEMQKLQAGDLALQQQKQQAQDQQQLRQDAQALPQNLSMLEQMQTLSKQALDRGDMTSAMGLQKQADQLIQGQSEAAYKSAAADNMMAEAGAKHVALVEQLLGSATDQQSWETANRLYTAMTGQQSPFMGLPYSDGLKQQMQDALVTEKDRIQLALGMGRLQNESARTSSYIQHNNVANDVATKRLALQRDAQQLKTGSPVGRATSGDVKDALTLLQTEVPGWQAQPDPNKAGKFLPAGPQATLKATELANDARKRMKQQPSLDFSDALSQSYAAAKSAGDFKTTEVTNTPPAWEIWKKPTTTQQTTVTMAADREGGANKPLDLPKTVEGFQEGKYYKRPDGSVWRYENGRVHPVREAPKEVQGGGDGW